MTRLGYMEVGRGGREPYPGDRRGHRGGDDVRAPHRLRWPTRCADRFVPLPDDLDPLLGVYVAHMGPICANGLLHAAADLYGADVRSLGDGVRGRRVAVTGAGVVGLLTALFARRHGAASVVVRRPDPAAPRGRRGARPGDPGPGGRRPGGACSRPGGGTAPGDRGADVVFQCRGQACGAAPGAAAAAPAGRR